MSTKVAQGVKGAYEGQIIKGDPSVKERGFFAQTLMATGVLVTLFTGYLVCQRTLVGAIDLMRLFFLLSFILLIVPHRFTRKRLGMGMLEWFLFNVLAIGPWTFTFIMWCNFFVHGEVEHRTYPALEVRFIDTNEKAIHMTDGWIEYHTALDYWGLGERSSGSRYRVSKATGLFGMDVVVSNELAP